MAALKKGQPKKIWGIPFSPEKPSSGESNHIFREVPNFPEGMGM
jgi:hypothetical protein